MILVTTKKGKIGKLSINARVNFGIETPIDLPDMLHTADFIDRKLAACFPNNPNSGWITRFATRYRLGRSGLAYAF